MSSPFHGLNIGLSAVQAQQRAMELVGQNVANANTPGYSRQRVNLTPATTQLNPTLEGYPSPPSTGSGVDVVSIRRVSTGVLARQLRNETASLREWEARQDGLTRIEGVFQDLSGQGLNSTLDAFWSAWRELAATPDETGARLTVIERGQQVAQQFNVIASRLTELQAGLDDQASTLVEQVNGKAEEVAKLNHQIRLAVAMDQQPNELLDRRDQLVKEIVETTGATVEEHVDTEGANWGVKIKLGGEYLVDIDPSQGTADDVFISNALATREDTGTLVIQWAGGADISQTELGGQLRGLLEVRNTAIPEQLSRLDSLAQALEDGVNAQHTSGYDADGNAGLDFFSGSDASDLTVNSLITGDATPARRIAAASTTGAPADGSNALELARVAEDSTLTGLGGNTIGGFHHQLVVDLGLNVEEADKQVQGQESVVAFLNNQREAIAGVSLDEEAVNLIKAQRAFHAAARVITSMDELLGRLINGMGIVGR